MHSARTPRRTSLGGPAEPFAAAPMVVRGPGRVCWGLFTRRERWGLGWRGWLLALLLILVIGWPLLRALYPFFAVTERVDAHVLVVEGWIQPYAIRAAVHEFETGRYERVITTGGPVEGLGRYLNDYSTSASLGASRLRAAGIDPARVAMAPSRVLDRDRTYAAAVALRTWLHANAPDVTRINVLTADLHARRTRLLFQEALGDRFQVGIIAVPSVDYDARHWWRYSEGVRTVLGEAISYLYARLLFFPSRPPSGEPAP